MKGVELVPWSPGDFGLLERYNTPEFQGQGLASLAARKLIEALRPVAKRRYLHAYPSVDHPASNAVCRKAGFELRGECEFEHPPGRLMRSRDWRFDLGG